MKPPSANTMLVSSTAEMMANTCVSGQAREEQRDDGHHRSHQHAAQHAAAHVARHDQPIRQRRHQQFLEVLAELRAEERGHDIAVGIGDHRHHDEAGRDELHVVVAADLADAPADQAAEDDEVQRGGDRRRHDGLAPDAHDAAELADDDGFEADPLGAARDADFSRHASRSALAAAAVTLPSTRRMNSSSSRLTLLRMLFTRDSLRRQLRENVVQALRLRHFDFQRVVVGRAPA